MNRVVVIGAGLAGCIIAKHLADFGIRVTMIEKSHQIGGKVKTYGCKAVDKCQNCGVCLTGGLWDRVMNHPEINIELNTNVENISGLPGNINVSVKKSKPNRNNDFNSKNKESINIESASAVAVCTGFEESPEISPFHLHINSTTGLLTGVQLEEVMLNRTNVKLFENPPASVAFIQCLGSRDQNEGGLYCSKVCCSYSTRAAKVIREYYPDCTITFFYMELQNVESGNYYTGLRDLGIDFIKCRPLKVTGGDSVTVEFDDPSEGIKSKTFDMVVLSEGIHANNDNDRLAELCGFNQDQDGFLHTVNIESGIYTAGCAKSPMKIDETCSDALLIAQTIITEVSKTGILRK